MKTIVLILAALILCTVGLAQIVRLSKVRAGWAIALRMRDMSVMTAVAGTLWITLLNHKIPDGLLFGVAMILAVAALVLATLSRRFQRLP